MLDVLSKITFPPGSTIIQQADTIDKRHIFSQEILTFQKNKAKHRFFLLLSGEASAKRTGEDGGTLGEREYQEGDYFGELALIRNTVRGDECIFLPVQSPTKID